MHMYKYKMNMNGVQTDGCQMFLSMESLNTNLITAKSSEMNLMVPNGKNIKFARYVALATLNTEK